MATATSAPAGASRYKAMLLEKKGPLPVWAWAAIVLAVLLLVVMWRRNRQSAADEASAGTGTESMRNAGAPFVFNVPLGPTPAVNVTVDPNSTVPSSPPGGGGGPSPSQAPTTVSAPGPETNLYDWVADLNSKYGLGYKDKGAAFIALFGNDIKDQSALNPMYRKYMSWRQTSGGLVPYFNPNWSGRTPPLGIPPVRIR